MLILIFLSISMVNILLVDVYENAVWLTDSGPGSPIQVYVVLSTLIMPAQPSVWPLMQS